MTRTSGSLAGVGADHPAELLRDAKGIYGIGIAKGAEVDRYDVAKILLRPDRLDEESRGQTIYQMITGGFRHGMFTRTSEEILRKAVHRAMLWRVGLCWPPRDFENGQQIRYWSSDKAQQTRNRQIFHGLRLRSLSVINGLIGHAMDAAAHSESVIQARRFRFAYRQTIYEAGARSRRALQLVEVFPVLALAIYGHRSSLNSGTSLPEIPTEKRIVAVGLVERGAPLPKIANIMDVPMALRRVKPGAADSALFVVGSHVLASDLINTYMPDSLPRMKAWLAATAFASRVGPAFVEWTAKRALEIADGRDEILSFLSDTADWVNASHRASAPPHVRRATPADQIRGYFSRGEEFVTRPFCSDMSLNTVKRLNHEWHEAVANNMDGHDQAFPEPWCDGGVVGDFEVRPITNSAELYREGHTMHHCVGTYADRVRDGEAYIYSVRQSEDRVATVELVRDGQQVSVGQIRGPCNSQVSQKVMTAVRKWHREQTKYRLPTPSPADKTLPELLDDELPF